MSSSSSAVSGNTVQVSEKLTNLLVVGEDENGDGLQHRTREFYNSDSRLAWSMVPRGYITEPPPTPAQGRHDRARIEGVKKAISI